MRVRSPARLAIAGLLIAVTVSAQEPQTRGRAVLRGFVLADSTEQPLVGAELTIEALGIGSRTGEGGAFRLPDIPAGTHIVSVRALGFRRIWARLTFSEADSLERDFLLEPTPTRISGVTVAAKAEIRNPKLAEFERRRASGFGAFISQQRIDSFPGRRLSNFMQALPGLAIQRGSTSSATWAAGTRLSGSIEKRPAISAFDKARGAKNGVCYSAVYLDGVPVYSGKVGETLFDLDSLQPGDVAGIEYYASASQMPVELNGTSSGTCGVVVIWTR
jgi:hypothetical protein